MIINLKLVKVNSKYCDYLREFDKRVVYNMNSKELRPLSEYYLKLKIVNILPLYQVLN